MLSWPREDEEKVARFVQEFEQWCDGEDLTDREWALVEDRAAARHLATDQEGERAFVRCRAA